MAFALHLSRALALTTRLPAATYRLQFNRAFTFADARWVVDYLHTLGVTDCYASSYLCAVPGSPHGYDVADPTRLNPDLGAEADYRAWVEAMKARSMGHVLDLVPNHMGIAKSANPWWLDVLENGPSSRFAHLFDIEWRPVKVELADKVLIPILGDQYGAVLERQELELRYRDGAFEVAYFDERFPIAPDTWPEVLGDAGDPELRDILAAAGDLPPRGTRDRGQIEARARAKEEVKARLAALAARRGDVRRLIDARLALLNGRAGDPASFDALDRLLDRQSYRLANWRVASEEINYRRFFDINQLAAVRMEDPEVFDTVHRFVFDLVHRGAVTGLRVDHVDGLYDPGAYLRRLHTRSAEALGPAASRPYLIVEKILGDGEELPREWPVDGTTGYEFAAVVNGLFVDGRSEKAMTDIYDRFVHERRDRPTFADLMYRGKKRIMEETMSGDINSLGHQLNRFSEHDRHFRDFTLYSLIATLKELIACFPVYRTYITAGAPVSDRDRRVIGQAVSGAKRRAPGIASEVFDFIERLLVPAAALPSRAQEDERARLVGKFQQITGPVAAKGIEDTALYIYNRLVSLNDVGADPRTFGLEPAAVHAWMARRRCNWPAGLSATSTHDSKRSEDVRARINVLSEMPGAWKTAVARWRSLNRRFKTEVDGRPAPGANEEYLLYQTLVGVWPFEADAGPNESFRARLVAYMIKALREAKVHTSWLSPDGQYEAAVTRFVEAVLSPRSGHAFLDAFLPFQARVAAFGIYNSLSQLVIKVTAPGIPDFYQGSEIWDLTLVDPDNRRPVDFGRRIEMLNDVRGRRSPEQIDELMASRTDGRLKLFVTHRALAARAAMRSVFERGDYVPLEASGARQHCVFAFARREGAAAAVTCVPRLVTTLSPDAAVPPVRGVWADTLIALPPEWRGRAFRDVFTGAVHRPGGGPSDSALAAGELFASLPVALLVSNGEPAPH